MFFQKKITRLWLGKALMWLMFLLPVVFVQATPTVSYLAAPAGTNLVDSTDQCCAYALHIVNLYTDERIKSIKVTGICATSLCCADADEWAQDADLPESVEWSTGTGGGIPYGKAIDNDFMVYLDRATSPHTIQVEFIDAFGNVVCRQTIQISCDGPFLEDEDWTQYTSRTALDDPNLFVFASREDEDDDEGDCDQSAIAAMIVPCDISYSITCSGGNTYVVTMNGPSGFDKFTWKVEDGPTNPSIGSSQNPKFNASQSGSYVISLMAVNSSSGDTCLNDIDVIIPRFDPDFEFEILPCQQGIKFKAGGWADPTDITTINWSCATIPGMPSSGTTVASINPGNGTYPVTMTITDKYGCTHSITKNVTIDNTCRADLKVESYAFCPDECNGQTSVSKVVTFRNLSTGGICPITYTWNFGDGTPVVIKNQYDTIVTHTYNVSCPYGQSYNVTLTMTDAAGVPCSSTKSIVADIEPCNADFGYVICPDGRVTFNANMYGTWSLPGNTNIAPYPYSGFPVNGMQQKIVARYGSGTYTVSFTGYCGNGGHCTVSKEIVVILECCAKNDRKRDKSYFTEASTDYKMKCRFAQNQLPLVHNIKAITKLKKKKSLLGISYWKGSKADHILASFDGTIYKRDTDGCNCNEANAVSKSDSHSNKKKAKAKLGSLGRFRSRTESITSQHEVQVGSHTEPNSLKLGSDCDKFRWWTDWF